MIMKKNLFFICCFLLCVQGIAQPDEKGVIFLSVDRGDSWRQSDAGLPGDAVVKAWIAVANDVIVGTVEHGVYISHDGLKSWHASNKGLPNNPRINAFLEHENVLFAGSYLHGIFISFDHGRSWTAANSGLQNFTVRCFYSMGTTLYAGTDSGIYRSNDLGKNWNLATDGMQVNAFTSLNGDLFAATNLGAIRSKRGENWIWSWKKGALYNITTEGQDIITEINHKIYLAAEGGQWINLDTTFKPFTFQITPRSLPMPIGPWRNQFKSLQLNQPFSSSGLPNKSFSKILRTPYGLLVAASGWGC
jgi:photosystem II stability/assembly factor-like uncharacterized protein